jgi:hypothetical protein
MTLYQAFYLFILPVLLAAGAYGTLLWTRYQNRRAEAKHSRR